MTDEEILSEIEKCKKSPYYFAVTYIRIKNLAGEEFPFTTRFTEEEFNKRFGEYEISQ